MQCPGPQCASVNGSFSWQDGSPFDYTRWAAGEPSKNNQGCGYSQLEAGWVSVQCTSATSIQW